MKITSRFAAKVVGVFLAAFVVMGLAACAPSGARINEDYLVLANVQEVNCQEVDDPAATAKELQATAVFVSEASPKQESDILKRNSGLESTDPLIAALRDAFESCGGDTGSSDDEATNEDETDVVLSPELKALLDAGSLPLAEFACTNVVQSNGGSVEEGMYTLFARMLLKVEEGNLDLRQWSTALSNTLKGNTPEEMRNWLYRAICEEPGIGIPLAHLFAHLEVEGTSVLSLQATDWLEIANVDTSEINDLIAQFDPITAWKLEKPSRWNQEPPDEVFAEAVTANLEYQDLASRLVFLVSRYQLAYQTMSIDSTHTYSLVGGGLAADFFPEYEISPKPDTRPSLVFYLTDKNDCKPLSVLAFNTGDKRPMLGSIPDTCESFVPPPVTPPPGGGGGCVTNCEPPPQDCPPGQKRNVNGVCVDSKSSDPAQWIYPEGKPQVAPPAGNGGAPAEVVTEQDGGGGVEDVITNAPNSDTGVVGEDAEDLGTDVRDTGENQGGDNGDAEVDGF